MLLISFIILFFLFQHVLHNQRDVVAQGHKGETVTRRLWVQSPLEVMNYYFLMFSYLRSGTKVKKSPALNSTIQHASKNSVDNGLSSLVLTLGFPLLTLLCAGYSVIGSFNLIF